jgi:hypothetical protein
MWNVASVILAAGLSLCVGMFVLGYFLIAIAGALAIGFSLSMVLLIAGHARRGSPRGR